MKPRTIAVVIVTLALQAFLALTPLMPFSSGLWHADNPTQFYVVLAVMVGLQFAILTGALLLTVESEVAKVTDAVDKIISASPLTLVKREKDFEFYSHFKREVELAKSSVRISYLAPYPPTDVNYKDRKKYYEDLLVLMKKRDRVSFKRLVRSSPDNEFWIAELLKELESHANNDIALLCHDLPPQDQMPLAMSVQVIDEKQCWLVALFSHERDGEYRDVFIENPEVAQAISKYFDRVWNASVRILDRGRITDAGKALIERVRTDETKGRFI